MPKFVFGVRFAKPFIAFHTTNSCGKSAQLVVRRDSLTGTLTVWALMIGFVHDERDPQKGILRPRVGNPNIKRPQS